MHRADHSMNLMHRGETSNIQHSTSNTEGSTSDARSEQLDVECSRLKVGRCRFSRRVPEWPKKRRFMGVRRIGLRALHFLCLMLFLLVPPGRLCLHAESPWPQFRGPNGSGVALDAKPPVSFGPASNALWTISLPSGYSSPCVWGGRIFLTAYDGEKLETLCVS